MLKQLSAAFVAVLLGATAALAQIEGQFPAGTVYGNSGASTARPSPSTVTGIIDQALGNTRGAVLERGASGWTVLAPGATANFPLLSGGAGADPAYAKLPVAGGGTNCTVASITCIQNILGSIAANTVLANVTGGMANVTAFVMPGCASDGAHALIWTNGSGFLCQALTLGSTILAPQGRLTLTTHTPVLTANTTAQGTVYYDCYVGNLVPYYTGSSDALDTVSSCEVSTAMVVGGAGASVDNTTGGLNSNELFDVWWEGNTNHNICIAIGGASNHDGWASTAGGGSANARSVTTGESALDKTTRPYITNKNAIAHCYNGSTDYGSITANKATYLGTIYTTTAGRTGMNFRPTAANGGTANVLGLYNAYNQIAMNAYNLDTGGNAAWTVASTTFARAHASASNVITYVDGLGYSPIECEYTGMVNNNTGSQILTGCEINWSSGAPRAIQTGPFGATPGTFRATQTLPPTLGLNVLSAIEAIYASSGNVLVYPTCQAWLCSSNTGQMEMFVAKIGAM